MSGPRAQRRAALSTALKWTATFTVFGHSPIAPGTIGTLGAALLVSLLDTSSAAYLVITVVLTLVGLAASGEYERASGRKDPPEVVIDEVAGYFISMAFLPKTFGIMASTFVIFRILDILKPPPIRQLQNLPGGAGIMADDVVAGILTNMGVRLWMTQNWI